MTPDAVTAAERERLTLIRQFILAPRALEGFPGWRHHAAGDGFHLYAHPELPVQEIEEGQTRLTLIGYIVDPLHPEWTDAEVLRDIGRAVEKGRAFHDAIEHLGGRWLLILDRPGMSVLYPDSCGLRQAYYGRIPEGKLLVFSQPGLLQRIPGIRVGDGLLVDRFGPNPPVTQPSGEMQILRLLPNHMLDLVSGKSTRFWPRTPFSDDPG